nr:hypothetical protein [uncultured Allomuricauda sp.]
MHIGIALEIKANAERKKEIRDYIWNNILSQYKRAMRLGGNFLVLRIPSQDDWQKILNEMTSYTKDVPETVHFIMTPPMEGSRYNGVLEKGNWDFINEITNE